MGDQALLSVYMIDKENNKLPLPHPTGFVINREIGAADDLTINFPYFDPEKYCASKIELAVDERIEFSGIIDELKINESPRGTVASIYSRSKAALLLDNEAKPGDYTNIGSKLLVQNHLAPFGIDYICEDSGEYTDLSIYKGTSHWQVIKSFCSACYLTEPYVDERGRVILRRREHETLSFSNSGELPYTTAEITNRYYKLISSVYTKATSRRDYDIENTNPIAESFGVCRTRYVDGALFGNNYALNLIERGNEESLQIKVTAPYYLHCPLGCNGKIKLDNKNIYDNLKCRRVKQSFSSNGFETIVYMLGKIK